MAIHIIRDDGTHVDVTHKEGVLELVSAINEHAGDTVEVNTDTSTVPATAPEEGTWPTETVEFTLRGKGWQWFKTQYNDDGSTTITLGR